MENDNVRKIIEVPFIVLSLNDVCPAFNYFLCVTNVIFAEIFSKLNICQKFKKLQ